MSLSTERIQNCQQQFLYACFNKFQINDIEQYRKRWKLLFQDKPSIKNLMDIHNSLQKTKQKDRLINEQEQLILQCIMISCQCSLEQNIPTFQWKYIQELMPFERQIEELIDAAKSFIPQTALDNPWSQAEENMLYEIVKSYKCNGQQQLSWEECALKLAQNSDYEYFRTARQVRERWKSRLNPTINKNKFNLQEDILLIQNLIKFGSKWEIISQELQKISNLQKRTNISIRHRYEYLKTRHYSLIKDYQIQTEFQELQFNVQWNDVQKQSLYSLLCYLRNNQYYKYYQCKNFSKYLKLSNRSKIVVIKGRQSIIFDLNEI